MRGPGLGSIICVFSHMINEIVILWCKSVVLHVRPYRFIVLVNDGVGFRRVNATQSLNGHERGRSTNRGVPRSERTRAHIVSSSQLWINLYSFFFFFFFSYLLFTTVFTLLCSDIIILYTSILFSCSSSLILFISSLYIRFLPKTRSIALTNLSVTSQHEDYLNRLADII